MSKATQAVNVDQTSGKAINNRATSVSPFRAILADYEPYFFAAYCYGYFFTAALLWLCLFIPLRIITYPFDRESVILHRMTAWLTYNTLSINNGWKVEFEGLEHLRNTPAVLVSNHQSVIDILVLSRLSTDFKWVAKSSVFLIPFIGQIMQLDGDVCISAQQVSGLRKLITRCRLLLTQNISVLMFPEGSRTISGDLLEFKDGAFRIATLSAVPVIPIVIEGTRFILPKYARRLNPDVTVRVRVLPPVYPEDCGSRASDLQLQVRHLMAETLHQMQNYR